MTQISFGGQPTIGFGDAEAASVTVDRHTGYLILGGLVGAAAGAVVGHRVHKNAGGMLGAVVGGAGGAGLAYAATELYADPPASPPTPPTPGYPAITLPAPPIVPTMPPSALWRPMKLSDLLQPGQEIAVAIASPYGAVPQDVIDKVRAMLTLLPGATPQTYAPGEKLPGDWPSSDDLGPSAFRYLTELTITQAGAAILQSLPPQLATIKAWVRNRGTLSDAGENVTSPTRSSMSPWTVALATSVVSAAAGWTIEEVARKVRRKRRR